MAASQVFSGYSGALALIGIRRSLSRWPTHNRHRLSRSGPISKSRALQWQGLGRGPARWPNPPPMDASRSSVPNQQWTLRTRARALSVSNPRKLE